MADDLHASDVRDWAEQQSALLRRVAGGERLNEAVDWANIVWELRELGLSEVRACRSLLEQAMVHLLKLHCWPEDQSAAHWREEVFTFLGDAADRYWPSMRGKVDLQKIYQRALRTVRQDPRMSGHDLPEACPFTSDDLLGEVRIANLLAKLASPA